ncbi:MAG: NAD-dependent epimerase/dehydratase family protein, partial [Myxococcota bacterium]
MITGIAGGLAQMVGRKLADKDFEVVGVDYRRPPLDIGYPAITYQANYNKTRIEDIFRRHPPTHVLHLGRVGNLKDKVNKRFDLNVIGSRKMMDLSLRYGAERLVVLSTFHIYGAHPANHIPIYEQEPLRAGVDFPQIGDAIQLDNQAVTWVYQHPEMKTAILRPTNVVGPQINNAMSEFLRGSRIPVIMGFDPMVQFVHQSDLSEAIVRMALGDATGVFNVAGPYPIPWRSALDAAGITKIPVPSTAAVGYLRLTGLVSEALPPYLVNYFMYPCVISDQKI